MLAAAQGCRGPESKGRGSESTSPRPKVSRKRFQVLTSSLDFRARGAPAQGMGIFRALPGRGSSQGPVEASGRLSLGVQPKHPEPGVPRPGRSGWQ